MGHGWKGKAVTTSDAWVPAIEQMTYTESLTDQLAALWWAFLLAGLMLAAVPIGRRYRRRQARWLWMHSHDRGGDPRP